MLLRKKTRAQSIVEYGVLLSVALAAILLMQVFIKRSFSGRLKGASDSISGGQSFSASSTSTMAHSRITNDRVTVSETATTAHGPASIINNALMNGIAYAVVAGGGLNAEEVTEVQRAAMQAQSRDVLDKGAYSAVLQYGGDTTATLKARTDAAVAEGFDVNDPNHYARQEVSDFTDEDFHGGGYAFEEWGEQPFE